jgi:hypothetical protein
MKKNLEVTMLAQPAFNTTAVNDATGEHGNEKLLSFLILPPGLRASTRYLY